MDKFIKELKAKGYKIGFKEYYGSVVIIEGIEFPIRLREKCRRVKKGDEVWRTSELEPIGKLVFTVDIFPRKEWEDSKRKLLDLKIPNIINYLEEKAKEEIACEVARKQRDKELEIKRKKEAEIRQEREQEEQKFKELLEACEKWHQVKRLREFIKAKKNGAINDNNLTRELRNWFDWAKDKVNDIDPL